MAYRNSEKRDRQTGEKALDLPARSLALFSGRIIKIDIELPF
jgi:hypothetical protein